MIVFGQTIAPSNVSSQDGATSTILQGKQADLVTAGLHGTYFTQTYRGNTFWASTAAAGLTLALCTATGATVAFILWNPSGSGKNAVLMSLTITPTTAATTADGYGYAYIPNAGNAIGTGATPPAFSVFTQITLTRGSGFLGATGAPGSAVLIGSGATITSATGTPLFIRPFGSAIGTGAITAPAVQPVIREDFDGSLIIPPGMAFIVGTTIVTSGQTASQVACLWEETPL